MADILDPELQSIINDRVNKINMPAPRPRIPSVGYLPEEQGVLVPAIQRGIKALSEFKGPGGSPVPAQLSGVGRPVTNVPSNVMATGSVPGRAAGINIDYAVDPYGSIGATAGHDEPPDMGLVPGRGENRYRIGSADWQNMGEDYWKSPAVAGRGSFGIEPARGEGSYDKYVDTGTFDRNPDYENVVSVERNPLRGQGMIPTSVINEQYERDVVRTREKQAEYDAQLRDKELRQAAGLTPREGMSAYEYNAARTLTPTSKLDQFDISRAAGTEAAKKQYIASQSEATQATQEGLLKGRTEGAKLAQKTTEDDRRFRLDVLKAGMNQAKTLEDIQKIRAERIDLELKASGGTEQDKTKIASQIRFDDERSLNERMGAVDKSLINLRTKADTGIDPTRREKLNQEYDRRQSLLYSYLNAKDALTRKYPGLVMPTIPVAGERFRLTDPNKWYHFNFGTGKIEESP